MAELFQPGSPSVIPSADDIEISVRPPSAVSTSSTKEITASSRAESWLCGAIAGLVWLLYFNFGREISYGGDDFGVIRPGLSGRLIDSLHVNIRPLEFLFIRLSFVTHFPFWLLASLCTYIGAAIVTLRFVNAFRSEDRLQLWRVLICATSPLAAQGYFRVDTVAQGLADLFTVVFAVYVVRCLRATEVRQIQSAARKAAVVAVLCLLSKETSYGLVLGGSVLLTLRHGRKVLLPLAFPALLLVSNLALSPIDVSQGSHSHYGLKWNPLYWLFTVVFSVGVAVSPIPTSLVLTGSIYASRALMLIGILGALLMLAGVILYMPRKLSFPDMKVTDWLRRLSRGEPTDSELLVFLLLCSLVPSVFFKAGELYATQALPYIKALLLLAIPARIRVVDRLFWTAACLMWVLASSINLMFYSLVLGADPSGESSRPTVERRLYSEVDRAVAHRTRDYSIYGYTPDYIPQRIGACYVDRRDPTICLPKNIVSGVPTRRQQPNGP